MNRLEQLEQSLLLILNLEDSIAQLYQKIAALVKLLELNQDKVNPQSIMVVYQVIQQEFNQIAGQIQILSRGERNESV